MRFAIIPDVQNLIITEGALRRKITHLVIHHSATRPGDAESFYRYHVEDRKWADIGYHYVVPNGISKPNGVIQLGRDLDDDNDVLEHQGAGVLGMNRHTAHICGVGNFDEAIPDPKDQQMRSIAILVCQLMHLLSIPIHRVIGHREAGLIEGVPTVYKTCPGANIDCNLMRDYFYRVSKHLYYEWAEEYTAMIQQLRDTHPELNILNSGG